MPKYAQINYGQVVQIAVFESLEEIYSKYYTKDGYFVMMKFLLAGAMMVRNL